MLQSSEFTERAHEGNGIHPKGSYGGARVQKGWKNPLRKKKERKKERPVVLHSQMDISE